MSGSVKGVLMAPAVESVRRLLDAGSLRIEDLGDRLPPRDLRYLDEVVVQSMWYPVDVCGRYVDTLWAAAQRAPTFPGQCGAFAAHEVLASRAYADMLETARRWGPEQVARSVINLAAQLYDFMEWRLEGDFEAASYAIEVRDAARWPDVLRRASEGFIHVLHSDVRGRELSVQSTRRSPDHVVFEIAEAAPGAVVSPGAGERARHPVAGEAGGAG